MVLVKQRNVSSSSNKASVHFIENSQQVIPSEVAEVAEKLDAMLTLLVNFVDGQISDASSGVKLSSGQYIFFHEY